MTDECYIERLPPEVLGHVFRFQSYPPKRPHDPAPYPPISITTGPMMLSAVCRRWRRDVLSRPELWCEFSQCPGVSLNPAIVDLWLERSGSLPISFNFQLDTVDASILRLLLRHLDRWKHASLSLSSLDIIDLARASPYDAKSLETLSLYIERGEPGSILADVSSVSEHLTEFLAALPKLTQLSWVNNGPPDLMITSLGVSWPHLRTVSLSIQGLTLHHCSAFLSRCPSVERVSISFDREGDLQVPPPPTIPATLPQLQSLEIRGQNYCDRLLDHLTLPSLQTYSLHRISPDVPPDPFVLERLLDRSSCRPSSLHMMDPKLTEEIIASYLRNPSLQSLQKLTLWSHKVADKTLQLLTWNQDGADEIENCLPQLVELKLIMCDSANGVMSEMIQSRWGNFPDRSRLTRVHLTYQCKLSDHTVDNVQFQELLIEGLNITWRRY